MAFGAPDHKRAYDTHMKHHEYNILATAADEHGEAFDHSKWAVKSVSQFSRLGLGDKVLAVWFQFKQHQFSDVEVNVKNDLIECNYNNSLFFQKREIIIYL